MKWGSLFVVVFGIVTGFFLFGGKNRSDAQIHLNRAVSFVKDLENSLTYRQVFQDGWDTSENPKEYIDVALIEAISCLEREYLANTCLDVIDCLVQIHQILCAPKSGFFDIVFELSCSEDKDRRTDVLEGKLFELRHSKKSACKIVQNLAESKELQDIVHTALDLFDSAESLLSLVHEEWVFCQQLQGRLDKDALATAREE